jgi:tetratricopeptide (TPR) repeat protein
MEVRGELNEAHLRASSTTRLKEGHGMVSGWDQAMGPAGSPDEPVNWPVRSGLSAPLADGFTARPETAPGLKAALVPGAVVVLSSSLSAPGGGRGWWGSCGKTQLAASIVESLWQSGDIELVVWVTATSRVAVLSGYVEAAVAAMGIAAESEAESVAARFLRWLSDTDRAWLVVFDDLRDAADLEGFWPEGPRGRVMITTADPATVPAGLQALILPVGVFSPREALSYLMGRLVADPDQRLGAIDLIEDLGCEPLALLQASAVIASSALTCRDYRERFARRREQFARAASGDLSATEVTWTLSVDHAERLSQGEPVELLLALAAVLDGNAIPGGVFTAPATRSYLAEADPELADPKRAWDEVLTLERSGLLTVDPGGWPQPVRMSPVIQVAIQAAMPQRMLDRAVSVAANALLEVWPEEESPAWVIDSLRSCLASLRKVAGRVLWQGGCHPLLPRAGRSLDAARLTGPAITYWGELVAACDRNLGADHPDTLTAGLRLADAYLVAGRARDAVSWFQWVLAGRARALGAEHPSVVAVQISLGRALVAAGQPEDAIILLEEVLASAKRGTVLDDLGQLVIQDALAAAYVEAGRYPDAIRLAQRTLVERERRQGSDHVDTMTTRANLASACLAGGRMKDAITHSKRTLEDRERVLGHDHPDTLASQSALATIYHSARRLKDALPLFERALLDYERIKGSDHPDTLGVRGNLASAYHSAGRMASAVPLYERSRVDCERVLGPHHPDTLAARANLAHAYHAMGRENEAVTLLRNTLADCERVLPADDPLTMAVRQSLNAVAKG